MDYYAAISHTIWDGGDNCGKCAKVCAQGNCVVVKIVDECASCHSGGHIDLSEPAMKVLTGSGYDMTDATWSYTGCSASVSRKQKKRRSKRGLLADAQ
jgi:hypothetical protein